MNPIDRHRRRPHAHEKDSRDAMLAVTWHHENHRPISSVSQLGRAVGPSIQKTNCCADALSSFSKHSTWSMSSARFSIAIFQCVASICVDCSCISCIGNTVAAFLLRTDDGAVGLSFPWRSEPSDIGSRDVGSSSWNPSPPTGTYIGSPLPHRQALARGSRWIPMRFPHKRIQVA